MAEKNTVVPARVDPFDELDWLRNWGRPSGMSRLMRDFFGGPGDAGRWLPPVDVAESDGGYAITVEIPGAKKEDVTVECHENVLTIRGEKKSEREDKNEHRRYVERSYGSFTRSFTLPADAAGDRVSAKFNEGVLTIEVPRAEERKPKVVDIKS